MALVPVNGVTLYVEEHGTGAPILGIHGTGSSALLWASAVPGLAQRGRVILYDRRGCGRSERPSPYETNVREHTQDAVALLTALDASPAVVIGRSYGGEVAVDLALHRPEVVRALVLLEPSMPMLAPELWEWLEHLRARTPAGTDPATVATELIEAAFGVGAWPLLPESMRQVFVENGEAISAEIHGGWTQPTAAELAALEVPSLLLGGEESPLAFRSADDALAAMLPGVRRELLAGDHLVDPASPMVLEFLEEVLGS
jgi:pimeloyl-ACP methyl ester carboxylesterase